MQGLDLKSFYAQSLGISAPWKVTEVAFEGDHSLVRITVECAAGVVWADPQTGERAEIKGWRERTWRHLDTCHFQTIVTARIPRLLLKDGKTMSVSVPWAEPGGRLTRELEEHVIDLLRECRTVRAAARFAVLTDDMVDGVMRRAVTRGLLRREESFPTSLGIDDKSIRKGHRYATLLVDLDNGCVIDVADGRTIDVAAGLLRGLSETARRGVEAIAMDMSPAYIAAAREVLPDAAIVFDRFHVAMHLKAAVDRVRRTEQRKLSSSGDSGLKNSKYFWLKSSIDLRTRGAAEFRALLARNLQTGTAWTLKENFRHFWEFRSLGRAMKFVSEWVDAVRASGLKPATTVMRHLDGILNHLKYRITNAMREGSKRDVRGPQCHGAESQA
jgi:transposase